MDLARDLAATIRAQGRRQPAGAFDEFLGLDRHRRLLELGDVLRRLLRIGFGNGCEDPILRNMVEERFSRRLPPPTHVEPEGAGKPVGVECTPYTVHTRARLAAPANVYAYGAIHHA